MQQSVVSMVIFLYIFISAALLIFNIVYMLSTGIKKRVMKYKIRREMEEQWQVTRDIRTRVNRYYQKRLYRKIRNADGLLVFAEALEKNQDRISEADMAEYICTCRNVIFDAAELYRKKPAMERALFAYFISVLPGEAAAEYRRLGEIFLSYLDQSTVYCRENVLQALYRLGNEDALIQALRIFQENSWHHDPKLISDGLAEFRGDKAALAKRLWNQAWDDQMKAALIRFMSRLDEDMTDLVLPELTAGHYEARFAAARYFAVHISRKAEPVLLEILRKGEGAAVAAAQALGSYPGEGPKQALKQALRSRNWHVRRNAAESLMRMELSEKEIAELSTDEDKYAREMFIYVLEGRGETA